MLACNDANRSPYLSVVVTTRNDDHGGDPLKRLQAFVNCFDEQCRRTRLDAEVIVVEWNPPPGKARVSELLRLPVDAACEYRFVEVPPELHERFRYADVLPLFQMIAKNVGIRRARGRFVLATNIDIIFSTALVETIAAGGLQPGVMYRLDRHDIEPDFPVDATLEEQMQYCASHHLRVHGARGSYPVDRSGRIVAHAEDVVDSATVRLGDGWHVREGGSGSPPYRWASDRATLVVDAAALPPEGAVLELDVWANPYDPRAWFRLQTRVDGVSVSRHHVTGHTRVHVPIPAGSKAPDRVVELVVTETHDEPRAHLPVFERRDALLYRLYGATVRRLPPASTFPFEMAGWINAYPGSKQTVDVTPDGLVVASDPRQWSYCVEYGPMQTRLAGTVRFELTCSVEEGRINVGVLSGGRHEWLPSTVVVDDSGLARRYIVEVTLRRREMFWLMVFNDHPDGEGVSRFVIHQLAGSVRPQDLFVAARSRIRSNRYFERSEVLYARAHARLQRVRSSRTLRRGWREQVLQLADWVASRLAQIAGERVRGRFVRATPEYASLERALRVSDEQLRAIAPLRDLADLHKFLREHRPDNLHVNGCGDFQLMAREHWDELRGYPEFETFSMNIDGLFSYIADAAGVREVVLEHPIYHLEHEVGSGWSPEGEAALRRRIAERGITWLDASTVYIWAAYMRWLGRPMIFNSEKWGFGDVELAERTVARVSGSRT